MIKENTLIMKEIEVMLMISLADCWGNLKVSKRPCSYSPFN